MKMRMPIRYGAAIMSAALATHLCVSHAHAQCTPEWKEGYTLPGIAGTVHCSIMHDDGTGLKLYVGGNFFFAGGTKAGCVARWNGTEWEQVGETFFANPNPAAVLGTVRCFAVYNGELYAGGQFRRNGLVTVNNIAKWDGSTWSGLVGFGVAGVLSNVAPPRINAMETYDDGTGTKLYVTGQFNEASGVPGINSIAKWDGTQFDYVGDVFLNGLLAPAGTGAEGQALKVYGGKLFVGGYFGQAAGTATTNNLATWSSSGWGSVGELDDNSGIRSFEIFDEDGAGPNAPVLAVAGSLTTVGIGLNGSPGLDVRGIARFDGNAWTTFGAGLPRDPLGENTADVLALAVHDNGSGPRLYAAGWPQFDDNGPTNSLWMWNGTDWVGVSGGPVRGSSAWGAGRIENGGTVSTLLSADLDGTGPAPRSLIAGGTFDGLGSTVAPNIAALTGGSWGSMPGGQAFYTSNASALNWLNAPVTFIAGDEDGAGPKQTAVYAYGNFVSAGDVMAPASIVRRDGDNWVPLASGPGGPTAAAVFHNDGTGTRLYTFQSYGYLDRWDGTAWSDVASVEFTGGNVRGATSFDDDGAGPNPARIYVCGFMHGQEGGPVGIGRWTGSAWQTVTSANVPGAVNPGFSVYTLSAYNGDLYAAGSFDAVDMSISYGNALAKWDGTSWQIVGEANGIIVALQEFGGVLYVGGQFASIGGVSSPGLARFDGTDWSDVGGGVTGSFPTARSQVASLGVADDGTGSKLFVGGPFLTAGGVAGTRGIAKWDGVEFSPLDIGISMASAAASPPIAISTSVTSVAGVNGSVFFAGNFNRAGTSLSYGVAEWGCEGSACTADFNGSGGVTADDIFAFLDAWFAQNGQTGANLSADFNNSQSVTADDIFAFLDAWFQQNGQPC